MLRNRLLLGYLSLVGLPLLALVGTLRKGEGLKAPPFLAGEWRMQPVSSSQGSPCEWPFTDPGATLTIVQSGTDVTVTVEGRQSFSTRMEDGRISGTALGSERGTCKAGADLQLRAVPAESAGRRILTGQLSVVGCAACKPIEFSGSKVQQAERRKS